MKKFFVIAAMLLAGFTASAQVNIGAGYMWDFWSAKNGNNKAAGGYSLNGVYAGVSYNIKLVEGLGIAPGAYFSWATGNVLNSEGKKLVDSPNASWKASHMALTIPVHLTYMAELGPGGFFAYLGPAFQYGLSLKETISGSVPDLELGGSATGDNLFKKDNNGNRVNTPFDVKLGVGFGYNWKFIQANVGFDWGFLDRNANKDDNYKQHANAVHAGIAFVF